MPNHVTTRCIVTGSTSELIRFRDTCIGLRHGDEDPSLDFQRIIPMPEGLRDTDADDHREYHVYYDAPSSCFAFGYDLGANTRYNKKSRDEQRAELDLDPKNRERADRDHELVTKYGTYDWYEWCCRHWGTKWNSYSFYCGHDLDAPEEIEFTFDTAWGFPDPIFEKLAGDFPTLRFECSCYDECGNFAGEGFFNGVPGFAYCDDDDKAGYDRVYEKVYGCPPEYEVDEEPTESEISSALATIEATLSATTAAD